MAIEEGKQAPPFALEDAQGNRISLADFRGKNVVVYFYPKDDTPGCTKEACGFRDLWAEIERLNTAVLGISPDSATSHQKFAAKYQLPFTLLSDPDKAIMTAYGAYGEKVMYGKKSMGVIRSSVLIDGEGRVRKHWRRVSKADQHPAQVLATIKEMG